MKQIEINGEKLKELVNLKQKELGTTQSKISSDLGFDSTYLGKCMKSNKIGLPVTYLLEQKYGIKLEDYKAIELQKDIRKVVPNSENLDLITTLNRIGNIQMQQLEYLKKIVDFIDQH